MSRMRSAVTSRSNWANESRTFSVNRLVRDLKDRGLRSKVRQLSTGATRGGVPFTQGPLFYMLRNRFYVGEVKFKDEILGGPQPALLERSLFEAVQNKLTEQWLHRNRSKQKNQVMLSGLLFDDAGHPMVATHASKNRVRYRYYMSAPLRRAGGDQPVGSVSRVPADEIEAIVGKAVRDHLQSHRQWSLHQTDKNAIRTHVERIEVQTRQLTVHLKAIDETRTIDTRQAVQDCAPSGANSDRSAQSGIITIDWTKPPARKFREVIQPAFASSQRRIRPIRAERRAGLIRAIARGRQWLNEIVAGTTSIDGLAQRQNCSLRQINMTLSMAFIAPAIVKAAIEGRLPRGIGIAQLRDVPPAWSEQFKQLGLPPL